MMPIQLLMMEKQKTVDVLWQLRLRAINAHLRLRMMLISVYLSSILISGFRSHLFLTQAISIKLIT
jgi:hypothetical protein